MADDSELHCSLPDLYLYGKYEFKYDSLAIYISHISFFPIICNR